MKGKVGASPGELHYGAKLSNAKVVEIRRRYREGGVTYLDLALDYDVAVGTVSAVLSGRTWRHLLEDA